MEVKRNMTVTIATTSLPIIVQTDVAVTEVAERCGNAVNGTSARHHVIHYRLHERLGHILAKEVPGSGVEEGEEGEHVGAEKEIIKGKRDSKGSGKQYGFSIDEKVPKLQGPSSCNCSQKVLPRHLKQPHLQPIGGFIANSFADAKDRRRKGGNCFMVFEVSESEKREAKRKRE